MTGIWAAVSLVVMFVTSQATGQSVRPSFAGTWTLRDGVTHGNAIVSGAELTITQTASVLRIKPVRDSVTLSILLDGAEHDVSVLNLMRRNARVTLTCKAVWDGNNLVIMTSEPGRNGRTGESIQRRRRETLSIVEGGFLMVRREHIETWAPSGPSTISERSIYQRTGKSK